ncbi:MAG: hypothetical protein ACI9FB_001917 [Candidatus Azotimanducaceae bacterium]|jgi:hypothetical protein
MVVQWLLKYIEIGLAREFSKVKVVITKHWKHIMEKSILTIAAVIVLSISSSNAFAARTAESLITEVFASSSGASYVKLTTNLDDKGAVCVANKRYLIASGSAGSKALLAGALTAKAAGLTVQLDVPDCSNTEIGNLIVK